MRRTTKVLLSVLGIVLGASGLRAQEILIVANRGVTISQIPADQLRDVFIGARTRFSDGGRAVPVLLRGGPVHEVFLRRFVHDYPDEFRVRWRRAVFTGQGAMPKEFQTEAAVLEYVAETPGAIGYVSRVPDASAVKVITVAAKK